MSVNLQVSGLLPLMLSFTSVVAAQASLPALVTVEQAVAEAVQNNPGLQAERLGITVAETGVITAGLRPNPVLSYSNGYLDWLGTRANAENNAAPTETALRVDLPVERGHKRDLRLENAGFGKTIAEAKLTDSIRRLRLDVTIACIDVMEAKARLALANDNLRSLDGIVRLNQIRLDSGAIAPVELTRSRVAMLQFRANVTTAELGLVTARTKLHTLLGRTGNSTLVDVAGEVKVSLPAQVPDLQEIQATALSARPDLQAVRLDQARSQAELRLQLAQGKIDYSVGLEYRRQQGANGRGNSLGLFVSAPLPIYNRNQGEIARVRAAQVQGRKSLEALEAQINGEVSTAYQEFASARTLVSEIERDLLKPSEEARTTTAYVYQAGASSLTDVLDAQRAFNETMSAYYGAEAAYRRAAIQLSSVVGQEVIP